MLKKVVTILFLMILANNVWAQDSCYAYASIKNFIKSKNAKRCNWSYIQPSNNNQFLHQDNEYYFYTPHDIRSLAYNVKTYFIIRYQDAWFVNTERLGIGKGFAKVLTSGKYWVIKAAAPQHNFQDLALKYNDATGRFEQSQDKTNIRKFMYYALDSGTMEKTALTFAGMLKLLSPYEALQIQFVKDKYNDNPLVIIEYIKEINRFIDYFENVKTKQDKIK